MNSRTKVNLPDVVGKGYKTFWNFRGRYRVVKGSRASKKSKTTALWFIYNLMKHPGSNLLVVRKVFGTLKDSCYSDLLWAQNRLKVSSLWENRLSPLEMVYKPTGQKILFRGLDDPLKITSITVDKGCLCFAWLEEAFEIMKEEDFQILDESIRGEVPDGLWKQWTITFNPWSDRHWLKHRFFDEIVGKDVEGNPIYKTRADPVSKDGSILAMTTNYTINEWLDAADKKLFEDMKLRNPKRYQVAGLGNWGIVDGLVYENWKEESFTLDQVKNHIRICGLDFGFTHDPAAFFDGYIDTQNLKLYVWDEIYEKGLSNRRLVDQIRKMDTGRTVITADGAEPKSISEMNGYGLRIKASKKGKDSILNGIQFLQDFEIIIHPRCRNFITEISCYVWDKDRYGKPVNKPVDDFNHLMDAMRYAAEDYIRASKTVMKTFKL
ncbi:PBSX family phage terminase large subunit [Ileibacterium valens]|uniref:PBSX family phage terminase large subunit n=1 Tax=Ileibacterium valens TaxID=1862668 RepID=UPI0024B9A7CF|nr:PBSX family phage terminase large subunit [Ileibacterium valens]